MLTSLKNSIRERVTDPIRDYFTDTLTDKICSATIYGGCSGIFAHLSEPMISYVPEKTMSLLSASLANSYDENSWLINVGSATLAGAFGSHYIDMYLPMVEKRVSPYFQYLNPKRYLKK